MFKIKIAVVGKQKFTPLVHSPVFMAQCVFLSFFSDAGYAGIGPTTPRYMGFINFGGNVAAMHHPHNLMFS